MSTQIPVVGTRIPVEPTREDIIFSAPRSLSGCRANRKETTMNPFTCTLLLILLTVAGGAAELASVPTTVSDPGLDPGSSAF
jgi:hypothetical protein